MKDKIQYFLLYKNLNSCMVKTKHHVNYYKQRLMTNRKIFATHIPYIQKTLTN